jgi:hypothetical protein
MRSLLALLLLTTPAFAIECPPDMTQGCKVLFLSPAEEQILVQPNGILATAADARKIDFSGAAEYFRNKIKAAPAGAKPEEHK